MTYGYDLTRFETITGLRHSKWLAAHNQLMDAATPTLGFLRDHCQPWLGTASGNVCITLQPYRDMPRSVKDELRSLGIAALPYPHLWGPYMTTEGAQTTHAVLLCPLDCAAAFSKLFPPQFH